MSSDISRFSRDFFLRIQNGDVPGYSIVHKFGHQLSLTTSYTPVCAGAVWRTPQVAGATTLRIKAGGHADDTAAGDGAREVTLYGISATGAEVSEAVATAGESESLATTQTFIRLTRAIVTASGTYASAAGGAHTAAITIEKGAGSEDWGLIPLEGFAYGQSQIGCYTIPLGKKGFIINAEINVDSSKAVDVVLFQRQNILETAAPYTAMRVITEWPGVKGQAFADWRSPQGSFPALTDIGFMAKGATTPAVSVDFTLVLVDEDVL